MDNRVFDQLTVSLAAGQSRRQLLQRVVGGALSLVAIQMTAENTVAQSCAGIQESCAEIDCCPGYGCNENNICIAAAECADFGEGCLTHEQCCGAYFCSENGTCIAAAECADFGQVCKVDENCCDDLVCGANGTCVARSLPSTGVGLSTSSMGRFKSVVAAAAGAALISGQYLRDHRDASSAEFEPARIESNRRSLPDPTNDRREDIS